MGGNTLKLAFPCSFFLCAAFKTWGVEWVSRVSSMDDDPLLQELLDLDEAQVC